MPGGPPAGRRAARAGALNTANGNIRWTCTTGNAIYSSAMVVGGVVYVGSEDGKVYALNAVS